VGAELRWALSFYKPDLEDTSYSIVQILQDYDYVMITLDAIFDTPALLPTQSMYVSDSTAPRARPRVLHLT
jgi:hypothetical protein